MNLSSCLNRQCSKEASGITVVATSWKNGYEIFLFEISSWNLAWFCTDWKLLLFNGLDARSWWKTVPLSTEEGLFL